MAKATAARTAPKPRADVARTIKSQAAKNGLVERNPKPVPKDNPIKVVATMTGYYDHVRRREGDVFIIANERAFSARWMEKVGARTPESVSTSQQAIQKAHDEILGGKTAATDADIL